MAMEKRPVGSRPKRRGEADNEARPQALPAYQAGCEMVLALVRSCATSAMLAA